MKQSKEQLIKEAISLLEAKTGKKVVLKEADESLISALETLSESKLFNLWSNYCDENSYDDNIYYNDENFYENFFPNSWDLAQILSYEKEFSIQDKYVKFDGYGGITTFNDIKDYVDLSDLADWIENNDIDLTPYGFEPFED